MPTTNVKFVACDKDNNPKTPQPSFDTVNQFSGSEGWSTITYRDYNGDYQATKSDGSPRTPDDYNPKTWDGSDKVVKPYQRCDKDGNPINK